MPEATSDFLTLREQKRRVEELARSQLAALQVFHGGEDLTIKKDGLKVGRFALKPSELKDQRVSISSAATCIRSLLSSPDVPDSLDFSDLLDAIDKRYEEDELGTRGLNHGNPYTLGQLLPTLRLISGTKTPNLVSWACGRLRACVRKPGVHIERFPANAYLTYWSLVALAAWGRDAAGMGVKSLEWSKEELYRQLALAAAGDDEADPYQLGYTLLTVRRFAPERVRDSITKAALNAVFDAQLERGVWEKKEPLFNYGDEGDAYPFAFELLNAVLREFATTREFLVPHQENFDRAVDWATRNAYGTTPLLWRSGHLADRTEPESWATAEIYRFLQNLRAYLADRILAGELRDTGRGRPSRKPNSQAFSGLWQPSVSAGGKEHLLGELFVDGMLRHFASPEGADGKTYSLARNPERRNLVRSGILYGPPGTGKTTYVGAIADYLGWPLLTITPADFAAQGMLLIPSVGRQLFDRLLELEDVVIFFDEMEELIRIRGGDGESFEQRFLTTSFLPSIQELRNAATCVYLIATNRMADLDPAARAPRRFDFQIQVRPPALSEKERLMKRDYKIASARAVKPELATAEEQLTWASLGEFKRLMEELEREPGRAAEIIAGFKAGLWDDRETLIADAEQNVVDALLT